MTPLGYYISIQHYDFLAVGRFLESLIVDSGTIFNDMVRLECYSQ